MGWGGSALHMIISYRNNMKMLRKLPIFKHKRTYLQSRKKYEGAAKGLNLKTASKEELAAIRDRIVRQQRKQTVIATTILIIAGIMGLVLFVQFRETLRQDEEILANMPIPEKQEQEYKTKKKYLFYINDGDEWLQLNNWHNAIYQFKMAIELYPTDYQARYRLALAYTYRCQDEKENCKEAHELMANLMTEHPEDVKLYRLRASYYYMTGDTARALADYETVDLLTKIDIP